MGGRRLIVNHMVDSPTELDEVFHDGPDEVARGWIIWHVIEHDLHHGGELSYSLGAHGLAGLNLP